MELLTHLSEISLGHSASKTYGSYLYIGIPLSLFIFTYSYLIYNFKINKK